MLSEAFLKSRYYMHCCFHIPWTCYAVIEGNCVGSWIAACPLVLLWHKPLVSLGQRTVSHSPVRCFSLLPAYRIWSKPVEFICCHTVDSGVMVPDCYMLTVTPLLWKMNVYLPWGNGDISVCCYSLWSDCFLSYSCIPSLNFSLNYRLLLCKWVFSCL